MNIFFEREEKTPKKLIALMEQSAKLCLEREGVDAGRAEISVTFVSAEEIRKLNAEYRGMDCATDVLSFPQFDDLADLPEEGEICLGDVIICREKIAEQAEEYGTGEERETIYLFTHSVLHLLGYDHETEEDRKEMRAREEEVMRSLKLGR